MLLEKRIMDLNQDETDEEDDYDEKLAEKIHLALMKIEQEKLQREVEKQKNQRLRKEEENQWRSRILEAAFDGDIQEIQSVLKELSDRDSADGIGIDEIGTIIRERHMNEFINCEDANGNSPLSEASAGGHAETVMFLIQKGADVNSRGFFKRTPLYRASFCGHLEVCQILLTSGADPRIYAEDGQTPLMVATISAIQDLLENWDLSITEAMLDTILATDLLHETRQNRLKQLEAEKLRERYMLAQREWDRRYQELMDARHELNKIQAIDVPGHSKDPDELLKRVQKAEVNEELARVHMDELHRKFSALKLQIPENIEDPSMLPGIRVQLRDLDEVLMRDTNGKIAESGKWPLVIDFSDQTSIFLRYSDTNYLDAYVPRNMEAETIRKAIIGGIRYGKPVVLDLRGTDMYDAVCMKFNIVMPGLMDMILSKEILENDKFMELVKEEDGEDYLKNNFSPSRMANFKVIFLTKVANPPPALLERTYPIRIVGTARLSSERRSSYRSCCAGVCINPHGYH